MNPLVKIVLIASVASLAAAAAVHQQQETVKPEESARAGSEWSAEFAVLKKVYDDCQDNQDFTGCLKGKALTALTRAIEQDNIPILDGLSLVKNNETTPGEEIPGITDGRALNGVTGIDRDLLVKFGQLLQSHIVRLDLADNGRGNKDKKGTKYLIAALLTTMGIAGPLGLKALALIAGKALVISKVALTIAGIIALKKIFSSDHHEETSFQVHAGDHNRRVLSRRNAYVVRTAKPVAASTDPYRYYYDQHYGTTA